MTDGATHVVHTLGPSGTNLEMAARWWLEQHGGGDVRLYDTLEQAVREMPREPGYVLLGCIVYPELHTLVFENLDKLTLEECFTLPTYNMVLAAKPALAAPPASVVTHPAPQSLAPAGATRILTTSNAKAAAECAAGVADACITTLTAARAHELVVLDDFGPVSMGFSVHAPIATRSHEEEVPS